MGRGKLAALLCAAVGAVLLLVVGLAAAVYYTVNPARREPAPRANPLVTGSPAGAQTASIAAPADDRGKQDLLAAAPMPTADPADSRPGIVSTRNPGSILLPASTITGPAGVPSGFPHTPQGAMAQLVAIDQTAMQSASLTGVRAVITHWAAPGGPTAQSWSAVGAMAEFLDAAGLSGGGTQQLSLVVTPLMGLIKGTVGTDFVIPCVDFEFDATLTTTTRVASADCQRMLWQTNQWVIGPGAEPFPPPSVWADTDAAVTIGYQDLRRG